MKTKLILAGLTLLAMTSVASAQSTVSGTLTGGGSATTSTSSGLTGTVGSGSSLTGTVVSTSTSGGSTGGTSGGGGGSGSGSNVIDVCPNITGVQTILPAGYVLSSGNCIASTSTGGTGTVTPSVPNTGTGSDTGTVTPGVPNTGAGGMLAGVLAILALAGGAVLGGAGYFRKLA